MKLTINGKVYDITRLGEPCRTTFGAMMTMCWYKGTLSHKVTPLLMEDVETELRLPLYSCDTVIMTDTGKKFDISTEERLKMLKRMVETENALEGL